jgi:cyclic pyranopterin phosphate synthase
VTANPTEGALLDGHGRRIDYLRLSVTDLCNLRCHYCMPAQGVALLPHADVLRHEETAEIVRAAASLGIRKVRVTGGEPLVKRGLLGLLREVHAIPGIETLALTTNGTQLAGMAAALREAGVDRINVSLDSLDRETYASITRGGDLESVLAGIDRALAVGFPLRINTVLLAGENTIDLDAFIGFAREKGVGLRFIERMGFERDLVIFSQDEALAALARTFAVEPLPMDPGSPHVRRFAVDGLPVGFISPMTHSFCGGCNKLRLSADGRLRACLAAEANVDLRSVIRRPHTEEELAAAFRRAALLKPAAAPWSARGEMWKVGG